MFLQRGVSIRIRGALIQQRQAMSRKLSQAFRFTVMLFIALSTPQLVSAAPTTGPSEASPVRMVRYSDKENGFSFDRPDGWEKAPNPNEQVVVMFREPATAPGDLFHENINVAAKKLPDEAKGVKIGQIMEQVKAGMKQRLPSMSLVEEGP